MEIQASTAHDVAGEEQVWTKLYPCEVVACVSVTTGTTPPRLSHPGGSCCKTRPEH
jgi:hypothetical protein